MSRPVRILGAGPAGLTAAIVLACAGRAVEVLESRRGAGLRFPGDLQGLENWSRAEDALDELRRFGISTDFAATPCSRLDMLAGQELFSVTTGQPAWYLLRRGEATDTLDSSLRRQAEAAGVSIRFGSTTVESDVDIIATGPRPRHIVGVGKGVVFETSAPDTSVLLLDRRLARTGYAYLLIADGHGVIACGIFDAFKQIDECFEATRRRFTSMCEFDMRSPRTFGGVEGFSPRPQWRRGDALVVGEAAGVQDLLWGFGIRTAMRSGWLAAQSMLHGRDYARDAERTLTPGLRASAVARALWECSALGNFQWTIRLLRSRRDPVAFVRHLYNWSAAHALAYPLVNLALSRRYPHFATRAS